MAKVHGIIFAYGASPELGELKRVRTAASLPFAGRYRLIDFSLSAMMNAGIHDVGVIMQRDYQSLLDHLGSGTDWDMARRHGGLRLLPPFGLPEHHRGDYTGTVEALNAVKSYVCDIKAEYVVLMQGDLAANVDLSEVIDSHIKSGAELTAICTRGELGYVHHSYAVGEDGFAGRMIFDQTAKGEGLASLEGYVVNKARLLQMMESCAAANSYYFHRDAVAEYLAAGGRVHIYVHEGYGRRIRTVEGYYEACMDMLRPEVRAQMFPDSRPVRTKSREVVSTYYGESSRVRNSLVADGCIIEGEVINSTVFPDVRVEKGARVENCVIMRGGRIGAGAVMNHIIADKHAAVSAGATLSGSDTLPFVIPKGKKI